jgi:sensor histidine kinase YesM
MTIGKAKKTKQIADELAVLSEKLQWPRAMMFSYLTAAKYYQLSLKIDSATIAYSNAMHMAKAANNKNLEASINGNMASIYLITGKHDLAITTLQKAIAYFENIKDFDVQGKFLVNLANCYSMSGNKTLALQTALRALTINTKYGDANTVSATNFLIGSLYGMSGQYADALMYHQNYAKLQLQQGNYSNACTALNAVASDYLQLQKEDSAIYFFTQAMQIAKENKLDEMQEKIALNMLPLQTKHNEETIEIDKLLQLQSKYEASNMSQELGIVLCQIASFYTTASAVYCAKNKLDIVAKNTKVLTALQQALTIADLANNYGLKQEINKSYAAYYESQKDFAKAYTYYKKYVEQKDSTINESKQVEITKLTMQYSFDKKEDSLKRLQANTNVALQIQSFLNTEQKQNLLLQQKELLLNEQTIIGNTQQLSILNKDKELQHLAYLKTQAELQTEQLSKREKIKELILAQNDQQLATSKINKLSQENENNILKKKQVIAYSVAGLITLLFASLFYYNYTTNKQQQMQASLAKEKAEHAMHLAQQIATEAELQKELTNVSLSALRSQMNPHFIFNSLNSINSVVVQGNIPLASDYLTKFSKLIRLILENSKSNVISLAKEIETLRLYVLMENSRFQNKFDYTIEIAEYIDADTIYIPPTTIQPFVENAIMHGLMHKSEKGFLHVLITAISDEQLQIEIKDNGVGRKAAAHLKSTTNTNTSYGLQITKERLMQLNAKNTIDILDIVDDELVGIGTVVKIILHHT